MITILEPSDGSAQPADPGSFTPETSSGTSSSATPSGSTTALSTAGVAMAVKIFFFRMGFDAERLSVDRWSYDGPFARPELQATEFNDSGIFHPIPDGLVVLDLAEGEVIRWAESSDPGVLVDSIDASTAIEDTFQAMADIRITRKVVEPFFRYLRAIIIGPASGILSGIRAVGDYDHPPATMTAGRLFTVTK